MTSLSVSRRRVLGATVWSAPVVLSTVAVPAYAASKMTRSEAYTYGMSYNYTARRTYSTSTTYNTTVQLQTTVGQDGQVAGLRIAHRDGITSDSTITLTRLDYYFMVPTSMGASVVVADANTATNWSTPVRVPDAYLPLDSYLNGPASTSGYALYKTSFLGDMSAPGVQISEASTWPGSTVKFTITGTRASSAGTSFNLYNGYIFSAATSDGHSWVDESLVWSQRAYLS